MTELQVQRRRWYTENLLRLLIAEIKWIYDPKYARELYHLDENTKIIALIGGVRMEFTADDEAVNVFSVSEANGFQCSTKQRRLKLTLAPRITIHGHYVVHSNTMHTHFRFSPTRDGMLTLLKLVDHSVSQMAAAS